MRQRNGIATKLQEAVGGHSSPAIHRRICSNTHSTPTSIPQPFEHLILTI